MRTWEEIKEEIEEYKNYKMLLVSEFIKGDCVECIVDGETYHGRVDFTAFDQDTGRSYVFVKVNKNRMFKWSVIGMEKKKKFFDNELNEIKLINNTFDYDKHDELLDKLNEIDDLPLSKSDRETKQYEIQKEIMNLRQTNCIHNWEEIEEGSWLNKKQWVMNVLNVVLN